MSYVLAIFIVLAAGFGAAGVTLFVQKSVAAELRREHHEVGSTVFLQLGVIFAVLLAFVFSEAWTEYNEASAAIELEVSALHGAAIIAATLPAPAAKQILTREKAYLDSVTQSEWPIMAASRGEDIATDRKLQDLIQVVANLKLTDPSENAKKPEILSLLAQAHEQRAVRIYQAGSGIPGALWIVLISFELILVAFVVLSGLRYWTSAALVSGIFAASVSSILVVARLLDYPFEGALALPSTDFAVVIGKVTHLLGPIG
ncbi:DUF4239 domain-containing protein [uncultured Methylovirgula sp.]|uniref:bestrophin-like domain n=1 Tax=uncultured Methylovirgula sp. TaxID=1285960 RepID=UPI002631F6DF|nr:DUF4239 domain-containing protein [uncultured Methylovirgula sp.]